MMGIQAMNLHGATPVTAPMELPSLGIFPGGNEDMLWRAGEGQDG